VATTSSILWERCIPVFVDIEPETYCIDATKIEASITENTKAIMAVHVFGNPCDIEAIEMIAKKHGLKVIYDGAHAFGVTYKGRSIFSYGDISTCSFHATKLFHTIEGGGVFVNDPEVSQQVELLKRFGHHDDDYRILGINAKANEFQAAMGLVNMKYLPEIIEQRKSVVERYDTLVSNSFERPLYRSGSTRNYAYYPIVASDEPTLLEVIARLNAEDIYPRRYFFPSLNKLPYIEGAATCPVSEDIARRIVCLPLYAGMEKDDINKICEIINR
jgi:dTDP-4-amino-4,6-dideoxygalactose transaminase